MANYSLSPQIAQIQNFGGLQNPIAQQPMDMNATLGSFGRPVYNMPGMGQPQAMPQFGMPAPTAQASPYNLGGDNSSAGILGGTGLGLNMPTFQLGMQGLGALSSFMMGNKSLDLANKQFEFTKATTNTNMNNQLQAYNGSLEDKLRTRGQFNGDDPSKAIDEYERRKLTRSA